MEYDTGEEVLVFTPFRKRGKSEKLLHRWPGLLKILEKLSPLVYKQEFVSRPGKIQIVNVVRMRKFFRKEQSTTANDSSDSDDTEIFDVELNENYCEPLDEVNYECKINEDSSKIEVVEETNETLIQQ